jgi:hypothetical protein
LIARQPKSPRFKPNRPKEDKPFHTIFFDTKKPEELRIADCGLQIDYGRREALEGRGQFVEERTA